MTRTQDIHEELAAAEYELQQAEQVIREMQDKIKSLRIFWDLGGNDDIERAIQELEK